MLCPECRRNQATVQLKVLVNNQLSEHQLCPSCARRKEAELLEQPALLLSELFALLAGGARRRPARAPRCPGCGIDYEQFRKTGRLGCAACYDAFAAALAPLMTELHGAQRHAGKRPTP